MSTRSLLYGGALAGPIFTIAWMIEGATRPDYSALRHPISSLAIGDLGWTQSLTFLVTGTLVLAFAVGLRRALQSRGGSRWAPILIGAMGVGLVGAALFVTDPLNGYPPGTPAMPLAYTVVGRLHRVFSALFFLGLPLACFVLARGFRRWGESAWATFSRVTGAAFLLGFVVTSAGFAQVEGLADVAGLLQRIVITLGWAWLLLLAVHLIRDLAPPSMP